MRNKLSLIYAALIFSALLFSSPGTGFAEEKYEIKEMTPEIKSALEDRKERFERLKSLKANGTLGENNRGYIEVLDFQLQANRLAASENNDRRTIYMAIEQQNNLSNAMETIEKVFAQVQRDKASPG